MTTATKIAIVDIRERADARSLVRANVDAIAESIAEVGLLSPVTVRATKIWDTVKWVDGYELIAGNHRLHAMKKLGREEIDAIIIALNDVDSEIAMIDENLRRADLEASERIAQTHRRQVLWVSKHGPAKAASGRAAQMAQGRAVNENVSLTTFTEDTARATGKTQRSIQLDAAIGKALGPDLARLKGTSLDKGVQLAALAKLPAEDREPLIQRAERGEKVDVRAAVSDEDAEEQRFWLYWAKLSIGAKRRILPQLKQMTPPAAEAA